MTILENTGSHIVPKLSGVHFFHFDMAPCAQRVRFVLSEKGVIRGPDVKFDDLNPAYLNAPDRTWMSRIVSLQRKDHFTEAYSKIQPNLVVPALVHDGTLVIESMDIVEYLDQLYGGDRLAPGPDDPRHGDIQRLTELGKELHKSIRYITYRWTAGRLGKLGAVEQAQLSKLLEGKADEENLVQFYHTFSNDLIPSQVYEKHLRLLSQGFSELETRLSDGRPFLVGDRLTMADAIWAMKATRVEEMGYPTSLLFPNVEAWFSRIKTRPSYSEVLNKYRALGRVLRAKAWVENALNVGLKKSALEIGAVSAAA